MEEQYLDRKKTVYRSYGKYLIKLSVISGITYIIKLLLPFSIAGNHFFGLLSFLFPATGTLACLIHGIQTFAGSTPPERLNLRLLEISYIIGLILFVLTST